MCSKSKLCGVNNGFGMLGKLESFCYCRENENTFLRKKQQRKVRIKPRISFLV
jgi:hypothetical protein